MAWVLAAASKASSKYTSSVIFRTASRRGMPGGSPSSCAAAVANLDSNWM
jgi:hypothetical protein